MRKPNRKLAILVAMPADAASAARHSVLRERGRRFAPGGCIWIQNESGVLKL